MLPVYENYRIYPAVVKAEETAEMTIVPKGRAFFFFEGEEYTILHVEKNGDETDHQSPKNHRRITVTAKDGVLRFPDAFPGEQEHILVLCYGEKALAEFSVYSLREDLYRLRPLKGDLHTHSYRSDGKHDPAEAASIIREQGYDFYALADHNRYYPGAEIDEVYRDVKLDLTRVKGEEVHTPGSVVHIVHVGGSESVAERYIEDPEGYEREVNGYRKEVPAVVPEQYRDRYARAIWASKKIREAGGLAIFPHPYWRPGKSMAFNVNDSFAATLLQSGLFDAYELIGGMTPEGNNRSVVLWSELRAEGLCIPVVGSSDVHKFEKASTFPYCFTVCFAERNENDAIVDAIRSGRSVAVEASGVEYDRIDRVYGSLRLVSYAQFLLRTYFPARQRICQGEGIAMRAYAVGECEKELIERQAEATERHRQRFFGEIPPVTPSLEMLEFESRHREIHLTKGPVTNGSLVFSEKITRQI